MINAWLIFALVFIVADWMALWKEKSAINFLTKPFALLYLLIWFWSTAGAGWINVWFLVGFFFSLAGDGFLLLSPRYFKFGLFAFLLAHLAFVLGLASGINPAAWEFWLLALITGIFDWLLIKRLIQEVRDHRTHKKMRIPILLYAVVISGMLWLAIWTLFRPDWTLGSSALVVSGAALFYFSDLYLAYDRFVLPKKNARLMVRITYHLGQLALAAGVILYTNAG